MIWLTRLYCRRYGHRDENISDPRIELIPTFRCVRCKRERLG